MHKRLWAMLLFVAIMASGCNLGGTQSPTDEPIDNDPPLVTGRPQVNITAPSEGDQFTVDEQLFVQASATDTQGVTRVQLFANGQIVKTVSSESLEGETALDATLDYTPRSEGEVRLRVLAFRGATASEPAEILINVVGDDVDVIDRPGSSTTGSTTGTNTTGSSSGSNVPVIPNDGVCRALTNVGLNFRTEPTTTRDNIITTLQSGTLAPIIARLGDNSWWKLSSNGRIGWVAAEFTTIYGNCQSVPIENVIINTPTPIPPTPIPATPVPTLTPLPTNTPIPGFPDLIVTAIVGEEDIVIPAGDSEVTEEFAVTITNLGAGPAGQFESVMRFEGDEFDLGVVSGLSVNQSIVFTQEITFDTAGEFDIRVVVDPDDDVSESSNVNNTGILTVNVSFGS